MQLALTVLMATTKWAARPSQRLIQRDPLDGYDRPTAAPSRVGKAWTLEQAQSFLQAVRDDRLSAAWTLLLTRGLRRGELAGLRWDAVELKGANPAMVIRATRIVVDGKVQDSRPKTTAGERRVPLDADLVDVLTAHQERQLFEQRAAGSAWEGTGHLFCNELGQPYHPEHYSTRFEQLAADAGLPRARLHDTRHTAATIMLSTGEPPFHVAQILGHSSTRITEDIYRHAIPGAVEGTGERATALVLGERRAKASAPPGVPQRTADVDPKGPCAHAQRAGRQSESSAWVGWLPGMVGRTRAAEPAAL